MKQENSKADVLQSEYRQRFAQLKSYRDSVWQVLVKHHFQPMISPTSEILDLGCGWGEFINHIQAGQRYAIDLNPDSGEMLDQL